MDFRGKKLLVLAGAGVHEKVVRQAKAMGIYTIVTDYLTDSPAKRIADETWMNSITDVDGIVAKCQKIGIDGVVGFCIDPAQRPYFEICRRLGLPCWGSEREFSILTDKILFKNFCREHGVEVIPEYSPEDVESGRVEYPVLVKPAMQRGSRGQRICRNRDEVLRAMKEAAGVSGNGKAFCEKFLTENQDISAAFFVIDGEPHLVKFGDRILGRVEDGLNRTVMLTVLPSRFSPVFESRACGQVKKMIKAMGCKFGPVFLQGFADGDAVRFYDPGRRMPGSDYDLMLKIATGFDTVKSTIHFALTGDTGACYGTPENGYLLNGGTAILLAISVRAGKIAEMAGLDSVLKHADTVYGREFFTPGQTIAASGDLEQRVAEFGAYFPPGVDWRPYVRMVYDVYHVYDENRQDMIVSRVDPDGL